MKIIAKQKIPANLELTACYAKRPDSYFFVNYGTLNGEKNLNCVGLTCKQIIDIINDKVNLTVPGRLRPIGRKFWYSFDF